MKPFKNVLCNVLLCPVVGPFTTGCIYLHITSWAHNT